MGILEIVSVASPLIAIVIGIRQRYTPLWLYAAAGLCTDLASYFIEPKQIAGNVFFLLEFILLSFFFRRVVYRRNGLFWVVTIAIASAFIGKWVISKPDQLQIQFAGLLCVLYIAYCLISYYRILNEEKWRSFGNVFLLGSVTAIFVYAAGCSLLFLFAVIMSRDLITNLWVTFFLTINVFRYLLLGYALYRKPADE